MRQFEDRAVDLGKQYDVLTEGGISSMKVPGLRGVVGLGAHLARSGGSKTAPWPTGRQPSLILPLARKR